MRTIFGNSEAVTREIGGQFRPDADKIVRTCVGPVCKAIWPAKTDTHIAGIVGCDPRNARRYLSGELPIPAVLLVAINIELTRRLV
jgi:hypothetical protein